ncbi:YibE/F family protein [Metabacillus sediminilitoris]|uniref:YibE/F family protein n=1 Tax=Metabacillus sediminilitoris TaxID=2567941 RepID=A0A4V6RXM9_9BACI|nr:YibE/F family protein [Metabacillus sediminilitoris]QGQ48245.1 YibE/F family protein [Metabacillus sediminilitoris]THF81397.1 YibE/F family protein [Metabacillus sediminilitoris]
MNVLVCLAAILFLLMVLIGGKKGARSFIALFLNFSVLLFTILIMTNPHANPIILTLIACTFISCINLFFINEVNNKTITAFVSTIITLAILLFFIVIVTDKTMIQGFGEEETEELSAFSLYLGVDFVKIGAAMIIMSTIGAIIDVAISISSPMRELYNHHPNVSRKELFTFGISIGRDILGTNTNTLFFAFFGGYLAMIIWFKDLSYSVGDIVNSKIFSAEMINILCAGIGIAMVIPITSWITAYYFDKTRGK